MKRNKWKIFSHTPLGLEKGVRWPKEGTCFCWSGISDFFQTHPPTERFPVVNQFYTACICCWDYSKGRVVGGSLAYPPVVCEKKSFVSLQLLPRQPTAVKWVCRKLFDDNLFTLVLLSRKNPVDENTATFSGGYYIFCKNAFLCFQESHSWLFFYYYFFLKSFLVDRSRFKCTCGSVVEVNLESERFTAVRSRCR